MHEGKPLANVEGLEDAPEHKGGIPKMSGKRRKKDRIGPETIAPGWPRRLSRALSPLLLLALLVAGVG